MTLEKILEIENLQQPVIFLHRTDSCWRAYEYSAFRFIREIPLTEHRLYKWIEQGTDEERVCLAFPTPLLSLFIENYPHAHIASDLIAIPSEASVLPQRFVHWKESIPVTLIQ